MLTHLAACAKALEADNKTNIMTSTMDYVPTTVLKSAADLFGYRIANLANLFSPKVYFPAPSKSVM